MSSRGGAMTSCSSFAREPATRTTSGDRRAGRWSPGRHTRRRRSGSWPRRPACPCGRPTCAFFTPSSAFRPQVVTGSACSSRSTSQASSPSTGSRTSTVRWTSSPPPRFPTGPSTTSATSSTLLDAASGIRSGGIPMPKTRSRGGLLTLDLRAPQLVAGRDPLAELYEVAVPVEDGELTEPPWLLGQRSVRVDHAGLRHLVVQAIYADHVHAARRRLRDVDVVGQPEVDLHAVSGADAVVRVAGDRFEAKFVGVEALRRFDVEGRQHRDGALHAGCCRIVVHGGGLL